MKKRNLFLCLAIGTLALASANQRVGAEENTKIYLWDAKSGEPIRSMPQDGMATSVAFSPDGSTLATGSGSGGFDKGFLNIWDVATGKQLCKAQLDGAIHALHFLPDGETLAVGTHRATLLVSKKTGKPIVKFTDDYTTFLDVSDDGQIIASNAGGKVTAWNVTTCKPVLEIQPKDYAYGVSISPDNKLVAFGSRAAGVGIAELATGKLVHTLETPKLVQSLVFSPDGKQLAAGNYFNGEIYIWDTLTRKRVDDIKLSNHGIFSLAWSQQRSFLVASVYHDRNIILLEPKTRKQLLTIEIAGILGARSVAVSPDATLIAAACTPTVMP